MIMEAQSERFQDALVLRMERGPKSRLGAASRSWTSPGKRFSSPDFRKKEALPTSWFVSQWDLFHGLLTSETGKQWICVVLSDPVCGNLLQQQHQERNIGCFHDRRSQREDWTKFPGLRISERGVCVGVCVCDTDLEITGEKRYLDPGAQLCSCSGGPPGTPSMFRKVTRLLRRCLWLALAPTQYWRG